MAAKLSFSDIGDVDAPPSGGDPNKPTAKKSAYDQLQDMYTAQNGKYQDQVYNAEPLNYDKNQSIQLHYKGGVKVPVGMIKDIHDAAVKAGIDPYILLGLAGQESTFGHPSGNAHSFTRRDVVSGWNLDDRYKPINPDQFLEQAGVPGVKATKTFHGYEYQVTDPKAVSAYLEKNPKLADKYKQVLATKNLPNDYNSFYEAAKQIKERGVKSYNPGDKKYVGMVQDSINRLKADPSLQKLMASFGGIAKS
jgi:hypothetical protein